MARARNIKPGFFTNDVLGELDPLARLLFAGLWTLCDREGRVEDRPKKIKAELLPYDQCDGEELLASLERAGFISRYEKEGKRVIQVLEFAKHQNPHVKEAPSSLPAQHEPSASTVQVPDKALPEPERAGLIPSSLIPDSLQNQCTHTPLASDWKLPKAWGEWALAEFPHWTADVVRAVADQFADHWRASAGSSADWQATWQKWCRDDLTQRAHPKPRETAQPRASPTVADGPLRDATQAEFQRQAAQAAKLDDPEEQARIAAARQKAADRMKGLRAA